MSDPHLRDAVSELPEKCPFSVFLVTTSYLPILGGSEVEAQRVSAGLISRGHRVEIICPGGPEMPDGARYVDACGIPVRLYGGKSSARLRGHVFAWSVAWTLLTESRRYDVAYFLMPGLQVVLGILAARLMGKPSIMKFSGSNEVRRLSQSLVGRLQLRILKRWTEVIMLLNPGMMREAQENGLPAAKLFWMPNPVDTEEFCPLSCEARNVLRKRLGLPENVPVILYVGRLAPEKDLASLIHAFGKISILHPDALLVLAGDGPCRAELTQLTAGLGIAARVVFVGKVATERIQEWFQAADVFALVSSLEGLPVSLIEAMSTSLPSVVSDIPANQQLVDHEREGLIVHRGDAESIATAIDRLLTDAPARLRMGQAARLRVQETFSTAKVIRLYEDIFARITGTRT